MNLAQLNIIITAPEILLFCVLCVVLLVDLFLNENKRWISYTLTLIGLALVFATQCLVNTKIAAGIYSPLAFGDMFINDTIAGMAKLVLYVTLFVLLVYSRRYIADNEIYKGEYYTLSLFALLGMMIMVSGNHFLMLYIGLELLSLALYALIALRKKNLSASEAALKYFVLGSLASGILLYGISLIYGATNGALQINDVLAVTYTGNINSILLDLGLVFVVVGIAFKLGTVPFHMWVPDVYDGAPTSVAAFVSTAPKIAAVVFAYRILVTGLAVDFSSWAIMLQILAVASLIVGNLAAIMQSNIKRMLAYSTISHMGFVLLAFAANTLLQGQVESNSYTGLSAAMYYAFAYVLMSLAAFGVLIALSNKGEECININDLAGLNNRYPWYAFLMLLAMFSMAGIPPLMGFYAKFYVIVAMLQQGYIWLSVFAVIMSLIGAFYYLRIVKVMYFDDATEQTVASFSAPAKLLLSINALLLLILGIFPQSVIDWCTTFFLK